MLLVPLLQGINCLFLKAKTVFSMFIENLVFEIIAKYRMQVFSKSVRETFCLCVGMCQPMAKCCFGEGFIDFRAVNFSKFNILYFQKK